MNDEVSKVSLIEYDVACHPMICLLSAKRSSRIPTPARATRHLHAVGKKPDVQRQGARTAIAMRTRIIGVSMLSVTRLVALDFGGQAMPRCMGWSISHAKL